MNDLKSTVTAQARACGFDLVGVTSADDFAADRQAALERFREGRMDGLPWYTESRVMRGTSPAELLPGARSVICLGLSYWQEDEQEGRRPSTGSGRSNSEENHALAASSRPPPGRVARYAWVRDYHRAMKRRMREFVRGLEGMLESDVAARWYVDDGPMLDRAAANRAGIGWFGKNTNILTPQFGSWVFLGQVITDLALEPDKPLKKSCGSCVRCIDDCPTGALVAPYVLDNARCISYLTIENRGPIPRELRPLIGDWVFGCDICQDVCPVNRKARPGVFTTEAAEAAEGSEEPKKNSVLSVSSVVNRNMDLVELLQMSDEDFLARFAGTSVMRAKRRGMQRNACVVLGNIGYPRAVPALADALRHGDPLVRGHAAWALGRIGGETAVRALSNAAVAECNPEVLEEIEAARREMDSGEAQTKAAPKEPGGPPHLQ